MACRRASLSTIGIIYILLSSSFVSVSAIAIDKAHRKVHHGERHQEFDPVQSGRVHVAMSGDMKFLRGIIALIRSVYHTASEPSQVHVWLLVEEVDLLGLVQALEEAQFQQLRHTEGNYTSMGIVGLSSAGQDTHLGHINVIPFTREDVDDFMVPVAPTTDTDKLSKHTHLIHERPSNFIRYVLGSVIGRTGAAVPSKIIYLDTDTLVLDDIGLLYEEAALEPDGPCLAAVPRLSITMDRFFTDQLNSELGFTRRTPSFNAGVLVMHLECWGRRNIVEKIMKWIERRRETQIFTTGSQPPMLLTFRQEGEDAFFSLADKWNVPGTALPFSFLLSCSFPSIISGSS